MANLLAAAANVIRGAIISNFIKRGFTSLIEHIVDVPEPSNDRFARSPTYGFNQWRNPVKGDATLPVVLSETGHKVAPVYLQAFVTPKGEYEDDYAKVLKADGQAMSALLALGEGPIVDIDDIRVNDEPLVEAFTETFTGNGTKANFKLSKSRILTQTLEITVDGTSKGYTLTDTSLDYYYDGRRTRTFLLGDDIAEEFSPVIKINEAELDLTQSTGFRPHVWLATRNKLIVDHQTTPSTTPRPTRITIEFKTRTLDGVTIGEKDGDTIINFSTAPADGAAIVVTGKRRIFKGVRVEWRNGGAHQLALPGFESIRNTYGIGTEIGESGSEVTFSTTDEVDDVTFIVTSGTGGFTQFDDEGDRSPTYARFKIEYRGADSSGNFTGPYTQVQDPAGTRKNKNADTFELRGDSLSQLTWSFSLRGLLTRHYERNKSSKAAQARLDAFTRNRYQVQVTRRGAKKNATNSTFLDEIRLSSYTEVIDEKLNYPGTALLAIHAIATSRLQGSAPSITCRVKGSRDVYQYTGSAWVLDATAQGNPVWGAIHVITNRRFGGGEQFTLSNIDTTSAKAAADFCDETLTLDDGGTEVRSRLDVVIDTRRSLLALVSELLRPAGIWPVLQGNTWRFVIDQAVDLTAVPTIWDDTTSGRIAEGSLSAEHDSITQKPTEIQVSFLDETQDYDRKEVWLAPQQPSSSRRIQRIDAFGVVRRSEVIRYADRVYKQATSSGIGVSFRVSPQELDFEAGDVIRLRSSRKGIDGYWRILSISFGTDDFFINVEAVPYISAAYGNEDGVQQTQRWSVLPVVTELGINQTTSIAEATTTGKQLVGLIPVTPPPAEIKRYR